MRITCPVRAHKMPVKLTTCPVRPRPLSLLSFGYRSALFSMLLCCLYFFMSFSRSAKQLDFPSRYARRYARVYLRILPTGRKSGSLLKHFTILRCRWALTRSFTSRRNFCLALPHVYSIPAPASSGWG